MEETRRVRRERIYPFRNLRRSAWLGEWYIIRILEDSSISSDGYEIKNDDGMHKCIPYEQTNGFTILQTWLIIGTGGTHKCIPYEQTNGFTILQTWSIIGTGGMHKCIPYEQNPYQSAMAQTKEQSSGSGWLLPCFRFALCWVIILKTKGKDRTACDRDTVDFYSRLSTTVSSSSLQASSCC